MRKEDYVLHNRLHTSDFLRKIGVSPLPPLTSPFDVGCDPLTLESHLDQSYHLMSILKISMASWMIADENAIRRKVAAAKQRSVPTLTGGGPFEIAVAQKQLPAYLDLCADIGFTRIECGAGFTEMPLKPREVMSMAQDRGLQVHFELGKKRGGAFTEDVVNSLIDEGKRWLDAGAEQLVIEATESAQGAGLFDDYGKFNALYADLFAKTFGLHTVMFEAPSKYSQSALLDLFGRDVHLCNVALADLLRVEIYRRGLHAEAFEKDQLRPKIPREISELLSVDREGS